MNQTSAQKQTEEVGRDNPGVKTVEMKLEVVVIPVSDAERAEQFYRKLGWRQDVTPPGSGVYQFTPHGSACSMQFGKGLTSAAPGSAQRNYLIVSDIEAARNSLIAGGIDVGEIFHFTANGPVTGLDPERATYRSQALFSDPDGNSWLLQEITDATSRSHRFGCYFVWLRTRSGKRDAPCRGCSRRAREATRAARRQLVRLVRRVHGSGAGGRRVADLSDYPVGVVDLVAAVRPPYR